MLDREELDVDTTSAFLHRAWAVTVAFEHGVPSLPYLLNCQRVFLRHELLDLQLAVKGVHPSGGPWTWPTTAGCTPGGFGGLYEINNNITNDIERKLVPLGAGGCLLPRPLPGQIQWDGGAV